MDYEKKYKQLYNFISDLYPFMSEYCKEKVEGFLPELKESEDEKIRKGIISGMKALQEKGKYTCFANIPMDDVFAWLEKQGEQNDSNVKDYNSIDPHFAKPIDKVEPKFKVGDWVVSPNGVYWHIDAIQNGRYEVTADTGQCGNWPLDTNIYRLWTIQDAKNGDVLSDGTTIFIFKDLLSDGSVISYCDYDTDSGESDAFCPLSVNLICSKITPATKEQRDLLFQKMKESGYEWDSEKKELKKVDVELTDFEKSLKHIMIETLECGDTHNLKADAEMLLRFAQKPAEWSEEDDDDAWVNDIISKVENNLQLNKVEIDWLKSLKERYTWKPSEEQMRALHDLNLTGNISYAGQGQVLIGLYNDLKKLKGE